MIAASVFFNNIFSSFFDYLHVEGLVIKISMIIAIYSNFCIACSVR